MSLPHAATQKSVSVSLFHIVTQKSASPHAERSLRALAHAHSARLLMLSLVGVIKHMEVP